MSKETKEDRLVRTIFENVTEHLYELKNIIGNPNNKETDVERFMQSLLRSCLGFSASSGYSIRSQETKGKHRPDLIVFKNDNPIFVCEIKKLDFDLQKSEFRSGKVQLKEYLNQYEGVRWGILSNGYEMLLLDFQDPTKNGIEVISFDFRNYSEQQQIETSKKAIEELCYDLIDFHENAYSTKQWDESAVEATAFSPESIARAVLSPDCIKIIAKTIRGEHDYKADPEVLMDKVYSLLCHGLDNSVCDWGQQKEAELSKFLKAQKRATRRTRRSRKKPETEVTAEITAASIVATEATITSTATDSEKKSA